MPGPNNIIFDKDILIDSQKLFISDTIIQFIYTRHRRLSQSFRTMAALAQCMASST